MTQSGLNSNDFRKVQIIDQITQVLEMSRRMPTWPEWRELPLSAAQVSEISDDVVTKLLGNSPICFSLALNESSEMEQIFSQLRPNLKTIVVFTSSDDELNNKKVQRQVFTLPVDTSGEIFPDQFAWSAFSVDFTPVGMVVLADAEISTTPAQRDNWLYLNLTIKETHIEIFCDGRLSLRRSRSIQTLAAFHQAIDTGVEPARSAA